jgi:hypothetical protein
LARGALQADFGRNIGQSWREDHLWAGFVPSLNRYFGQTAPELPLRPTDADISPEPERMCEIATQKLSQRAIIVAA